MKPSQILLISVLLFFPLFHWLVVYNFSYNSPYYDCFLWSVGFLNDFLESNTFSEKLSLIFSQHNQHRIVWLRLSILLIFKVLGVLNLKYLVLIGNIGTTGIGLVLYYFLKRAKLPLYFLLPSFLVLFSFIPYHNLIVSFGVPNTTVVFFAVLSIFIIAMNQSPRGLWLGLFFGVLAMYTNGSGIVMAVILPLLLLLIDLNLKHKLGALAIILLAFGAYFISFETDYNEITFGWPSVLYLINFAGGSTFLNTLRLQYLLYLPAIAWIFVYIYKEIVPLLLAGGLKAWQRHHHFKLDLFAFLSILFVSGSELLATLFRVIHYQQTPDWYSIYPLTFYAIYFIWFFHSIPSSRWKFSALVLGGFIGLYVYANSLKRDLKNMASLSSTVKADAANYQRTGRWLHFPSYFGNELVEKIHADFKSLDAKNAIKLHQTALSKVKIETRKPDNDRIQMNGVTIVHEMDNAIPKAHYAKERYGYIRNAATNEVLFYGTYCQNNGKKDILKYRSLFSDYCSFEIQEWYHVLQIEEGNYHPGFIFLEPNGNYEVIESTIQIFIRAKS